MFCFSTAALADNSDFSASESSRTVTMLGVDLSPPLFCPLSDFDSLGEEDAAENNQLAFDVAEREFGIQPVIRGEEMAAQAEPDQLLTVLYLSKFYEAFRIPAGNRCGQVPFLLGFLSVALSSQLWLNVSLKIQIWCQPGRRGCTVELFNPDTNEIRNKILHLKTKKKKAVKTGAASLFFPPLEENKAKEVSV